MLEENLYKLIKKAKLEALTMEPTDNYYDHTTFCVHSLSEFITLIEAFTELNAKFPDQNFLYRGMADLRWGLVPSLMRRISELPHPFSLEHDLAVEFSSQMPSLFQNADSNFERIAKMQHFGIPTRLLDFTLNPLVALYFACAEHPRTSGRIVFTLNKVHHFDDQCVECISSLYLYDNCVNIKVDDWVRRYNVPVSEYLFHTYTNIYMSDPLFVKPLYLDNRMQAQRSVFLLFHNYVRDLLADCAYYNYKEVDTNVLKEENLEEIYREQIEAPRITLGEHPYFVVDKCSFERLTDSYRKHDIDHFLEKIETVFSNRFNLDDAISPLEMQDIWFGFSSIVIPSKCKKQILSQLEHIGIDEAYVYPEAEYIAKRIKRQQRY